MILMHSCCDIEWTEPRAPPILKPTEERNRAFLASHSLVAYNANKNP